MRSVVAALAALFAVLVALPEPISAQTSDAPSVARTERRPRSGSTRPKREPTAGQLAARDRMRKCAAEWKEAKAAKTTGGLKWPQYWHQCNTRLKGGGNA